LDVFGGGTVSGTDMDRKLISPAISSFERTQRSRTLARARGALSDTADAIAARVQAFRELKNVVDEKVLREVTRTVRGG
jgi:hypothetical protein